MVDVDISLLDDSVIQLPTDMRAALRNRCETDLYYFNKAIMGFKDMTPRAHGDLCQFLQHKPDLSTGKGRFKLILMPRDHYKSSCGTIGSNAQHALANPDDRILIVNEIAGNAQGFLRGIRSQVENNRVLRSLWSDVIPKDTRKVKWNDDQLTLNRSVNVPEATITAAGMTTTLVSQHFTRIFTDDPISDEAFESDSVMETYKQRLKGFSALFVKPKFDTWTYIGTPWALKDTVTWFREAYAEQLWEFARSVYDVDGELLFPELISHEVLAQKRRNLGEYRFSCWYLLRPSNPEEQSLDSSLYRTAIQETIDGVDSVRLIHNNFTIRTIPLSKLDITMTVDLAASETLKSDRNAINVTGLTPWGEVVVLEAWGKRCRPSAVIDQIFAFAKQYHPRAVGIEGVAYQKAFKHFVTDRMNSEECWFKIEEFVTSKGGGGDKKPWIKRAVEPLLRYGKVYVGLKHNLLCDETRDYPFGEYDDVLESFAMQTRMWKQQLSPEYMQKLENEAKKLERRSAEDRIRRQMDLADVDEDGNYVEGLDEVDIAMALSGSKMERISFGGM